MNWWKNYREEYESIWWLKEDKVLELQEIISTGLFKIIIAKPEEIEFKQRVWYDYISVFHNWEFICYITKEEYFQFVNEDSVINKEFSHSK